MLWVVEEHTLRRLDMPRQTNIDKKIKELDDQIAILVAVREALYGVQGGAKTPTTPTTGRRPRRRPADVVPPPATE
jgi:hypothetical protein